MTTQPFDAVPLWALYVITLVLIMAALGGGYWYVKARSKGAPHRSDAQLGAIAGATLGLLAFLMAFVLGFGVTYAGERRTLVVDDANAIRTAYLRAGYIDEPYSSQARTLLKEYVDLRVEFTRNEGNVAALLARTQEIHGELWTVTENLVEAGNTTDVTALFVESVNEMISVTTERINMGLYVRTAPLILLFTYLITLVTAFLVGMQIGYSENVNWVALILLVVVLSAVLYLIFDLDRPQEGLLKVPQQAILDLQSQRPGLP
jgi:hypothetical protein